MSAFETIQTIFALGMFTIALIRLVVNPPPKSRLLKLRQTGYKIWKAILSLSLLNLRV